MMDVMNMAQVCVPFEDGNRELVEMLTGKWFDEWKEILHLRSSSNHIFLILMEKSGYILRFADSRDTGVGFIEPEYKIISHLREKGFPATEPIVSKSGSYMESFDYEGCTYNATMFRAVKGDIYEADEMNEKTAFEWGRSMAEMHSLMRGVGNIKLRTRADDCRFFQKTVPDSEVDVHREFERVNKKHLMEYEELNKALLQPIHYDYQSDNLIWKDSKLAVVIDFDDKEMSLPIADVANVFCDLYDPEEGRLCENFRHFLDGYASLSPISGEMLEIIPWYHRFAELVGYARLKHSYKNYNESKAPDWLIEMKERHYEHMKHMRKWFSEGELLKLEY